MRTAFLARWSARLAATAVTGLFIAFLVGEGAPDLRAMTDQELGEFFALFIMVAGTLVGWRRDLLGGLLLLAGYALFAYLEQGWPPAPFAVYPAAGLLLLLSALLRWISRRRTPASAPDSPTAPAASEPTPGQAG